jgi:threonine dehydratase
VRAIPLHEIEASARTIYDLVVRTPVIPLPLPDSLASCLGRSEIFLKLETLQPVGSFKIRGAHNAVRQLGAEECRDGIWTVSAGNAAQGVALAARHAGVPCSVMVMNTAPQTKLDAIRRLGATIVSATYDECWETVEAHRSSRMRGRFVHPFDDDRFIAGNGTLGLEILEDVPDVDVVVGALGGGGLLSGVGSAVRARRPQVKIIAAEPETAAPLHTSLRNGRASVFEGWKASFVDGAGGKSVLPTMWPLLKEVVTDSIVVSLDEVAAAMRRTADRVHVVAEGAAGCAIAAALTGKAGEGKIVAVVSGGNIDLSTFARLVGAAA